MITHVRRKNHKICLRQFKVTRENLSQRQLGNKLKNSLLTKILYEYFTLKSDISITICFMVVVGQGHGKVENTRPVACGCRRNHHSNHNAYSHFKA